MNNPPALLTPVLLTVNELSTFLKVSPHTIYYWVSRSEIPAIRMGKHLRFDRDTVLAHFIAVSQQSSKASTCLEGSHSIDSRLQSWSLKKLDTNPADSSKKGIGNGNN